jgi:hypothetical protein
MQSTLPGACAIQSARLQAEAGQQRGCRAVHANAGYIDVNDEAAAALACADQEKIVRDGKFVSKAGKVRRKRPRQCRAVVGACGVRLWLGADALTTPDARPVPSNRRQPRKAFFPRQAHHADLFEPHRADEVIE